MVEAHQGSPRRKPAVVFPRHVCRLAVGGRGGGGRREPADGGRGGAPPWRRVQRQPPAAPAPQPAQLQNERGEVALPRAGGQRRRRPRRRRRRHREERAAGAAGRGAVRGRGVGGGCARGGAARRLPLLLPSYSPQRAAVQDVVGGRVGDAVQHRGAARAGRAALPGDGRDEPRLLRHDPREAPPALPVERPLYSQGGQRPLRD
mmetsp:Transcript_14299/g.45835  ORF Transcript_14299/g.45835 Transcript_14299/m.45835 type:complete len:204 (+) Transcript_14299:1069-1680(+)